MQHAQNKTTKPARAIGYYLIALILVAVVPLLAISGILVWHQSELQRNAFERSLLQTAVALSVAVDRQLNSYRVMLETLAESESLRDGDITSFHRFSARVAQKHGALFVSLFDHNGRQLFNTLRPPGEPLPTPFKDPRAQTDDPDGPPVGDPTYLKQAFASAEPNNSDLTYGLVAGRLIFLVNIPVMRQGHVAYVLNAAFVPDVMTRLLQENPQFRGVPAVIFDRKGFIVGRWQGADAYVGKRVRSYERMKNQESGVDTGETLEGMKLHYSYARSPVTGWGVNIGAEGGVIERQVHTIQAIGGALAGLGLLLGVLFALLIAGRLRASIVGLADAASANQPPRLRGLRTRELVELERALDASAAAHEAQARERESRVAAEARKSEAEEANRLKDRFIALLSHELRNPLAPIRTSVHLLRAMQDHPDRSLRQIVDMLDRQSEQLTRLVNDLLDVSRVSAGKMALELAPLDLRAVARHAIETAQPRLDARRHRLSSRMPEAAVPVMGDFARLSQVLSNLLDNAAKFTPNGGEIEVTLRTEHGFAVASVRDNGRGIDPQLLPNVFTPFTQYEKEILHRGEAGLGLGLSIAKSLAERHGGSLEAKSEGAGRGSEFTLRLPLARVPNVKPAAAPPARPPVKRRVLIVDDYADAAESLGLLLRSAGCEIRVVSDGEAALTAERDWAPDAVLLDIGMPGMDGYEVARRLRASAPGRAPLIVALTGWGHDIDKERAREAGFDNHLTKPVEVDELLRALSEARARR